jgi:hypothetical protein
MPDASWWDSQPGAPVRTPEELAARVRLLEGILLRVRDELAGAASWEELPPAEASRLQMRVLDGSQTRSRSCQVRQGGAI